VKLIILLADKLLTENLHLRLTAADEYSASPLYCYRFMHRGKHTTIQNFIPAGTSQILGQT
jgi:hypothetical protein